MVEHRCTLTYFHNQITCLPIRTLIRLILKSNSYSPRHATLQMQHMMLRLCHHSRPTTNWTSMPNRLSLASANITRRLHLLKDAGRQHMFLNPHTTPTTSFTHIHNPICASRTLTRRAHSLLLNVKLDLPAIVKVSERSHDASLFVGSSS